MASKDTARNQIPAVYRLAKKAGYWKPGLQGVDVGCGYDRLSQHLHEEEDIHCLGYDPEWKTKEQNDSTWWGMGEKGDFVTLSNVLNVIQCEHERREVLVEARWFLRDGGALLLTVYEGDKDGRSRETRDGWQEHRRLRTYLSEVKAVFSNAVVKGGMIVATKERS